MFMGKIYLNLSRCKCALDICYIITFFWYLFIIVRNFKLDISFQRIWESSWESNTPILIRILMCIGSRKIFFGLPNMWNLDFFIYHNFFEKGKLCYLWLQEKKQYNSDQWQQKQKNYIIHYAKSPLITSQFYFHFLTFLNKMK